MNLNGGYVMVDLDNSTQEDLNAKKEETTTE